MEEIYCKKRPCGFKEIRDFDCDTCHYNKDKPKKQISQTSALKETIIIIE